MDIIRRKSINTILFPINFRISIDFLGTVYNDFSYISCHIYITLDLFTDKKAANIKLRYIYKKNLAKENCSRVHLKHLLQPPARRLRSYRVMINDSTNDNLRGAPGPRANKESKNVKVALVCRSRPRIEA